MKEVKHVATKAKFTQEEILNLAAHNVSLTISSEISEDVAETFEKLFREKAYEMLQTQNALLLTIGPLVTTDNPGIYSKDIRSILDYVEEQMQMHFEFVYGLLMLAGKEEFYSIFLPH